jgi:hypothetical protein
MSDEVLVMAPTVAEPEGRHDRGATWIAGGDATTRHDAAATSDATHRRDRAVDSAVDSAVDDVGAQLGERRQHLLGHVGRGAHRRQHADEVLEEGRDVALVEMEVGVGSAELSPTLTPFSAQQHRDQVVLVPGEGGQVDTLEQAREPGIQQQALVQPRHQLLDGQRTAEALVHI